MSGKEQLKKKIEELERAQIPADNSREREILDAVREFVEVVKPGPVIEGEGEEILEIVKKLEEAEP